MISGLPHPLCILVDEADTSLLLSLFDGGGGGDTDLCKVLQISSSSLLTSSVLLVVSSPSLFFCELKSNVMSEIMVITPLSLDTLLF